MTRALWVSSILVAILAGAADSAAQDSLARVRKLSEPRTITVSMEISRKDRGPLLRAIDALVVFEANAHASGFLVGDGLVMTAYHVVSGRLSSAKRRLLGFKPEDALEVKVQVNGCEASIVKVDEQADLALLKICGRSRALQPPAFRTLPSEDEPLFLVARPGYERLFRRGSYAGSFALGGQQFWSAKIDGEDGFSGSPVYNVDGQLVGVFCLYDWTKGVALLSPAVKAQQFLAAYDAEIRSHK